MKRIYILLVFLMIMFSTSGYAMYPIYLNGDNNYILCDGHMGQGWYVVRDSLAVEKYESPEYILRVNVVTAESAIGDVEKFYSGGKGKITKKSNLRFKYNWQAKEMYFESDKGWKYLNPVGCWAETGVTMPAGEIAFALAYKMKFYGSRTYYDVFLNRFVDVFEDDFYKRVGM